MRRVRISLAALSLLFLASAVIRAQNDRESPNIAGKWTIYVEGDDTTKNPTKTVEFVQDGNQLTGKFKGPNQSGNIQGHISPRGEIGFHTKTRTVLVFRGQLEGNTMRGQFEVHEHNGGVKTASWTGVRAD